MRRRGLLALAIATPAAAQGEFPPRIIAAGRPLVLNGTGSRLYSVFAIEVYRAALYLEAPSRDAAAILASATPKLIIARYRRDVPLRGVQAAWEQSLAPMPPEFLAWLAPLSAGDEERYLFLADGVALEASGRQAARVPGMEASRRLLEAWIGARAPTEGLRRGLLGG